MAPFLQSYGLSTADRPTIAMALGATDRRTTQPVQA
jgi:hypothetical protein